MHLLQTNYRLFLVFVFLALVILITNVQLHYMLNVSFEGTSSQLLHHDQIIYEYTPPKKETVLLQQHQQEQQDVVVKDDTGYDIVTLVHENDIEVFTTYGIESWQRYFVYDNNTRIYAICTPVAKAKLDIMISKAKRRVNIKSNITDDDDDVDDDDDEGDDDEDDIEIINRNINWNNLILIPETIFPFNLQSVGKHLWGDKFTWIYQQLLKLYSYEILSTNQYVYLHHRIKHRYLIIDSDTVAIRPTTFLIHGNISVYNIASEQSGAFDNDCVVGERLVKEVFNNNNNNDHNTTKGAKKNDANAISIHKSFPNYNGQRFTPIAHHMMIDGNILGNMLRTIETMHNNKPAWQVLRKLTVSILSEYELYMSYVMHHHRDEVALRPTPYVNWGTVNSDVLIWLRDNKDVHYLSRHDDYNSKNICCVNSLWSHDVAVVELEKGATRCPCCSGKKICQRSTINCSVLGINGCYDDEDGYMRFNAI